MIAYDDEPQEDLFRGESILEAANRVLDFEAFKKQQKEAINNFNEKLLKNAETINYVDDINLDDVKDNKNLKISAKKISDKYKKLRKRKAEKREKQINEIIDEFKLPKKKEKSYKQTKQHCQQLKIYQKSTKTLDSANGRRQKKKL